MVCVVGLAFFFFQAEDGIRDLTVTGVQTCALPISSRMSPATETILLVEDEEIVRRLACDILEAAGYQVLPAKNGEEAIEICTAYRSEERRVGKECRSRWSPYH